MDREQCGADPRDRLGVENLINQPLAGRMSLLLNSPVTKREARWAHVPVPHGSAQLSERLAYHYPIDVGEGDRETLEIHA